MKTMTAVYVDVALLSVMKAKAKEQGVSFNAFAGGLWAEGMARLGTATTPHNPAIQQAKLSRKEEAVMRGVKSLQEQNDERDRSELEYRNVFFTLKQISRAAGLYPSVALHALRTLEHSGHVRCEVRAVLVSNESEVRPPPTEHWHRVDAVGPRTK